MTTIADALTAAASAAGAPPPALVAAIALAALPPAEPSADVVPREDGRRHRQLDTAVSVSKKYPVEGEAGWRFLLNSLIAAHEVGDSTKLEGLRHGVTHRFFKECPHPEMVAALREATGLQERKNGNGKGADHIAAFVDQPAAAKKNGGSKTPRAKGKKARKARREDDE